MFSSGHSSTTQWRLGKPRCLEAEWHVTHFQTACGSKVNMKTFHTSMCGRGSARGRRSCERLHPRTKASNQRPRLCLQSLKSQRSPREAERLRGNQQHVKPKLVLWKYQQNWQTNWPRVLRWHTNCQSWMTEGTLWPILQERSGFTRQYRETVPTNLKT